MRKDLAKIYAGITHSAIPFHISDRAYKVATGTEFTGKKFLGNKGGCGRCGHSDETTRHRYHECGEVRKLWQLISDAWHRISGGEKLDPVDPWFTLWGARWIGWKDEEEKKAYGSEDLEEVFQVIHKSAIQAIHESASRKEQGACRLAQHMYERLKVIAYNIVKDRIKMGSAEKVGRIWIKSGYIRQVGRRNIGMVVMMWS